MTGVQTCALPIWADASSKRVFTPEEVPKNNPPHRPFSLTQICSRVEQTGQPASWPYHMSDLGGVAEATSADDRLFNDDADLEMEQYRSVSMADVQGNWFAASQKA